ncbi:hypothetical protein EUGRSUZ_F01187 [Eucalyptus grandis]|uniref:Uncharacterized protein n=2 Tax=Eucalyptus grandis TaxID=71139 RepID=A0ACC3KDH7_EUCGR|nr:hypothetical protein EUGRSUZ_F01187 [Eucalyptus grandis]
MATARVPTCGGPWKSAMICYPKVTYSVLVGALCKQGRMEEAVNLLEEMKDKGLDLDVRHYTTLIDGYCLQRDFDHALNLLKQMIEEGIQPDIVTYNVLAHGYSRAGLVYEVHELLRHMDACGVKPNVVTHNVIIEGLCISGNVEEAEVFFSSLQEKSIENKVAMFKGYCQANHSGKAFKFFMELSEAEKRSIKINSCIKLLANLFVEGDHVTARELLNNMSDLNMEPTRVMYGILMATLCKAGDMRNAQWLFVRSVEKGTTPDVVSYTLMMDGYFHANCLSKVHDLFREMKNRGVEPDVITYTVLLDGYSKVELWRKHSLCGRNKAKKVTVDSEVNNVIKSLLLQMKDKKIALDVKCYTVLIDRHCKLGNIEEAEDLLRKMIESGLQPDVVTYTSLISGCYSWGNMERAKFLIDRHCKLGNVEEAEDLLRKMIESGLQPDGITHTSLISGCYSRGNMERAKYLL